MVMAAAIALFVGGHCYYRDNYDDDGHGRHPC
jgi:hypothetical protein